MEANRSQTLCGRAKRKLTDNSLYFCSKAFAR